MYTCLLVLCVTDMQTLQKQLGARLTNKNAVSKAGKLLMKSKTGEDRAVLKKKLVDLDREWDKACSVSVDRQDKLENAYQELAEFRYIRLLCSVRYCSQLLYNIIQLYSHQFGF